MGPRGPMMLTVQGIEGDAVKVDLNHPMAGKRLHFNVKIAEVREARPEEIQPAAGGGCACGPEAAGKEDCGPGCACG
jgi:FKBP-type peptidyl-prolyl cis-trans isomerase SlyD